MAYDIFLSYRRKDAEGHSNVDTARTFKYVFERCGFKDAVFLDQDECTDSRFKDKILPAIRTCEYFVLLLTKDALVRCKEEGDWVRKEIVEAKENGRKFVPITPDGVFDAWPSELPEPLSFLSEEQITTIHRGRSFESDIKLLIKDRRMEPQMRHDIKGATSSFPKLKVICNMDGVLFKDGELVTAVVANQLTQVPLPEGEYILRIVSSGNLMDYVEVEWDMPNKDKLFNVDLLGVKNERVNREMREKKEQEERERRAREEQKQKELFELTKTISAKHRFAHDTNVPTSKWQKMIAWRKRHRILGFVIGIILLFLSIPIGWIYLALIEYYSLTPAMKVVLMLIFIFIVGGQGKRIKFPVKRRGNRYSSQPSAAW